MPLFPAPLITEIQKYSRLRPEQVSAVFSSEDVRNEISERLYGVMARVRTDFLNIVGAVTFPFTEEYLTNRVPSQTTDEVNEDIKRLLTVLAILLLLHDLFSSLPQLSKSFPDYAEAFMAEYNAIMASIAARVAFITRVIVPTSTAATSYESSSINQVQVWV